MHRLDTLHSKKQPLAIHLKSKSGQDRPYPPHDQNQILTDQPIFMVHERCMSVNGLTKVEYARDSWAKTI